MELAPLVTNLYYISTYILANNEKHLRTHLALKDQYKQKKRVT